MGFTNIVFQRNLTDILISGLTGLYRGITTNIASSAPISAIYTFTYESVKGALLPIFPKVPSHYLLFNFLLLMFPLAHMYVSIPSCYFLYILYGHEVGMEENK